jgi:glycosyltransferase involved in cell wall biosynthesis
LDWEIILVGNYFPHTEDQTPLVVQQLAQKYSPNVKSITEEKAGMMGWDMRSGLDAADGKVLAIIDGDGQMPTEDVYRCYKLLKQDNYDLVKTIRKQRYDGRYRRLLSTVYNTIFSFLFPNIDATDINSKPKVLTRGLYEQMSLTSNGWFIDAEIMISANQLGAKIGEIDTYFFRHTHRSSFVKPISIFEFLFFLILYRLKTLVKQK